MSEPLNVIKSAISADTLSFRNGVYIARKEFFYTHGNSAEKWAAMIQKIYPSATIVETQNVWKAFRGGADTAHSSHFLVRFTLKFA
jgi:hypothetical protein